MLVEVTVSLLMQTENEAAVQQIKRLKLEHVHSQQQLVEENVRLQRTLAQVQVTSKLGQMLCCPMRGCWGTECRCNLMLLNRTSLP